jgi:hypothetical protein
LVNLTDVRLGGTTQGLLLLQIYTWVEVQASIFPRYFLCKEGIRTVIKMGLLLAYGRKSKLLSAVGEARELFVREGDEGRKREKEMVLGWTRDGGKICEG